MFQPWLPGRVLSSSEIWSLIEFPTMRQGSIFYLVYASAARELCSEEELFGILEKFRTSTAKAGITGLLLYYEGNFLHILEGKEEAVEQLFTEHILADRRHCQVSKLTSGYVSRRSFADWSMSFRRSEKTIHRNNLFPNFSDLLESRSSPESIFPNIHQPLLALIHGFYLSSGFDHDMRFIQRRAILGQRDVI